MRAFEYRKPTKARYGVTLTKSDCTRALDIGADSGNGRLEWGGQARGKGYWSSWTPKGLMKPATLQTVRV